MHKLKNFKVYYWTYTMRNKFCHEASRRRCCFTLVRQFQRIVGHPASRSLLVTGLGRPSVKSSLADTVQQITKACFICSRISVVPL